MTVEDLLEEFRKKSGKVLDNDRMMKMYNEKAMLTQRETLENWQGWEYKPIKRNGRKQAEHIKLMNFVRDEINKNVNWRDGNGRKTKKRLVNEWRQLHPDGKKAQCHRDTGISRPTIDRWWDCYEE